MQRWPASLLLSASVCVVAACGSGSSDALPQDHHQYAELYLGQQLYSAFGRSHEVRFANVFGNDVEDDSQRLRVALDSCGRRKCVMGLLGPSDDYTARLLAHMCSIEYLGPLEQQHLVIFARSNEFEFREPCINFELRVIDYEEIVRKALEAGITIER